MVMDVPYIEVPIGAMCCYIFLMFSFFNTRTSKAVKYFQLAIFCCIVWSGGDVLMRMQTAPGIRFWYNLSLLGLLLIPLCIYGFLFSILEIRRYALLAVCGLFTFVAIFLNYSTNIVLKEPKVLASPDGTVRYDYTTAPGIIIVVILELLLCIYVTVLAHKRIGRDWEMRWKLFPLLLGLLLVLAGNYMDLIPGHTFPYDSVGGVLMAVCIVFVVFRQYRFDLSYRMTIGMVYMAAMTIILLPIWRLATNLENVIGSTTVAEERFLMLMVIILCIWSAVVMAMAHRQADRIMDGKQRRMMERVQRFQEETVSLFSEPELYRKIRDILYDLYREAHVCIYIRKEEGGSFVPLDSTDAGVLSQADEEKIFKRIAGSGTERFPGEVALLKYDNTVKGFIFMRLPSKDELNYIEVECFHQIGNYASICLKNIDIFEEVYEVSIHDELTGLYNRNYWKQYMKENLSLDDTHSFIYLDVDDFKLFNELYGGACGDEILRWCGKVICRIAKEAGGVTFRIGSNEFLIDIQCNDKDRLLALTKAIQDKMAGEDAEKPKVLQPVTFSIGIAMYPGAASEFDELLRQAERATFFAKRNGKNRVEIYEVGIEGSGDRENESGGYEQVAPTIFALMAAIDAKDSYTFEHSMNVSKYAVLLGKKIGLQNNEIQILKEAGLLHDIGKIGIPESILKKQGKLTQEEYGIMKSHVTNSIEMIHFLPNMNYVIPAVLSHHERYDGKGYPRGIAGEDIPLLGRILAVCDSFDAMISKRSYKDAMSLEYAVEEIRKNKGTQFDPRLAEAFIRLVEEGRIVV